MGFLENFEKYIKEDHYTVRRNSTPGGPQFQEYWLALF